MPTTPSAALQRLTLGNGLTVYLREDHRASLVSAQLWYHVGSSQEPTGQSGLCHLVEHLMFEGSRKLAPGDYSKVMTQLGGNPNAFTMADATCFPVTLPASRLEVVLEIMADAMVTATFAEQPFARELEVVKAERRLHVDNSPMGLALERAEILANSHSPYATPTIGHLSDLQHLNIANVRSWYDDWYQPNNASLVIVGAIDMATLRPLVERHFASIPAASLPERWAPATDQRCRHRSQTIALPGLPPGAILAFNTPSLATAGDLPLAYALRLIPELLANGSSSRLYLREVRGKERLLAVKADYGYLQRGHSLLTLVLHSHPTNATAESATHAVLQQIDQLRHNAPTEAELKRAKTRLLAQRVYARDNIAKQADTIGLYVVSGLDPAMIDDEDQWIESITAEDIRRAADRYLTHERLTITYLHEAKTPSVPRERVVENTVQPLLSLQHLDLLQIDLKAPKVHSWETDEGAQTRIVAAHELPMVDLVLSFAAGSRLDGDKPGLAALTLFMLDEGTSSLDAAQFAEHIEQLGAVYRKSITHDRATITLRCLTGEVLEQAIDLIIDMVAQPALKPVELAALKVQVLETNKQLQASPRQRARGAALDQALGGHPYGSPTRGTDESIAAIDADDIRLFHQQAYSANNLEISLVGDLSPKAAQAISQRICKALPQGWLAIEPPPLPAFKRADLSVKHAGNSHTLMMLLPMGAKPTDDDYLSMVLANDVLGSGGDDSRLYKEMRLKHGLTYAIRSAFTSVGSFLYIEWDVASKYAEVSRQLVRNVLGDLVDQGPTQAELDLVKQALLGDVQRSMATNHALSRLIATQAEQGLPADNLSSYGARVLAVTPEMAHVALKLRLAPLHAVTVSVGPEAEQHALPAIDQ
ncbi:M16 family metallopeptidase [Pseudomonas sp. NPDC089752]|uniref:M16 family metallopeptidase n=1 Tax=Pseudomonas sp. NPDC089752 TaxID=3364472 RepID=UPI00381FDAD4